MSTIAFNDTKISTRKTKEILQNICKFMNEKKKHF